MRLNAVHALAVALGSFSLTNAHGDMRSSRIDGVDYVRGTSFNFFKYLTPPEPMASWFVARRDGYTSQDPIVLADFDTYDAICGKKSIPGELAANHTAGTKIVDTWRQWPDNHDGFFWYHVAYCGGARCADVDPESLEWTTIQYTDFIPGRKQSDGDRFTFSNLLHETLESSVTTPKCLKDGEWVLKATAHSMTNRKAGSEIYTQCINLNIQGGGNVIPAGIPGKELFPKDDITLQLRNWNDTEMDMYAEGKFGHAGGSVFSCPLVDDVAEADELASAPAASPSQKTEVESPETAPQETASQKTSAPTASPSQETKIESPAAGYPEDSSNGSGSTTGASCPARPGKRRRRSRHN